MSEFARMDKEALFDKADKYRDKINHSRPLSGNEIRSLKDYFKISLTYTSNAIEGNTLTESETKVLIEDGLTVGGKPVKDYYEAAGHAEAYEYMQSVAQDKDATIDERLIKKLHRLFYQKVNADKAGKYRTEQIFITGTEYVPPTPDEVPRLMNKFVNDMNREKGRLHPIEWAALLHKGLVDIHPFIDGNGRTARLLMNLALIQEGYGLAVIPPVLRGDYIAALKISQTTHNSEPFICLIATCVIETQKDYCRMLNIPLIREKKIDRGVDR